VRVLSVDGRRDVALAPHPADDFAAAWSPDGQRILFTSNRTGPLSLWTLAVKDGQAQGEPQLAFADAGNIESLGITRNGSLYYYLNTGLVDVYTAAIDPESAAALEPPKPLVHRFVASNQFPDCADLVQCRRLRRLQRLVHRSSSSCEPRRQHEPRPGTRSLESREHPREQQPHERG